MNIEFGVKIRGKCSEFGGPSDSGVSATEGLALYERVEDMPQLFLPEQPINTSGLARRLNPDSYYIAMRWDYSVTPKAILRKSIVRVLNEKNNKHVYAIPCDWGPNARLNRVCDLSPGIMKYLELETDDVVECLLLPIKEFTV